jgi:DNA polymerase III alpha subunit (gram-positive type)
MTEINYGVDYKVLLKQLITTFDKYTIRTSKSQYKPILVAHNADFDAGFLEVLFAYDNKDLYDYIDKVLFCTQREMERIDGYIEDKKSKLSYTLGNCCNRMGIELKNAHGAMNDVIATTELFNCIVNKMRGGTIDNTTKQKPKQTKKARQFFEF